MKLQLSELLSQKSAQSLFDKAMQYPMDKASHMAGRLKLDGRPVNVRPWPQDSQIEKSYVIKPLFPYIKYPHEVHLVDLD